MNNNYLKTFEDVVMISEDYYDLTNNPHTEVKLDMLRKYLSAWADILLGQYRLHTTWTAYKTLFYIDCFSGRGKYHKNGKRDCTDGSPLIALKIAEEKQKLFAEKHNLSIKIKCIFIEKDANSVAELKKFAQEYNGKVDYEIKHGDFNDLISKVVDSTGFSPAFFFVDPAGIKELKKKSVEKIVGKKGARDIMLNYIINGPRRITGLARSVFAGALSGKDLEKHFKVINTLVDFAGLGVLDQLELSDKQMLQEYVKNIIEASNAIKNPDNRLETIAYDMKHPDKSDLIYYLLFSSRKNVAIDIMKAIFRDAKKTDYSGQAKLGFPPDKNEFDI